MNGAGNNYRVDFEFFAKAQGFIKTLKETQGHVGALGKMMEGPFKVTGKAVGELKNSIKEAAKVHKDWVKDSKGIQTELTNILRKQVLEYTSLTKKMKELTDVQKTRRSEVLAEMQTTKEHLNMMKEYSRNIGGSSNTWGRVKGAGGVLLRQAGFGLAAAETGATISTALKGVFTAKSMEQSMAGLAGLVGMGAYGGEARRAMSLISMGYSPHEAMQIANVAQRQMGGGTRFLGAMSRATGLGLGEVAGWGGQLRQLGQDFVKDENSMGARTLTKLFALGTSKGLQEAGFEKSRVSEFINASISLARRQGQYTTRDVNPLDYARQLAFWTMSGRSGLQGTRGAHFFSQLDQTIRAPGGGDAGRVFMLMSMGFGDPTKKVDFYEAMKMMQRGASDPGNIQRMLGMLNRQYGWKEGNIVGNILNPGISIEGWEDIRQVEGDRSLGSRIKRQRISQILEKQRMIDPVEISKKIAGSLMGLTGIENKILAKLEHIGKLLEPIAKYIGDISTMLMDVAIKYFGYDPARTIKEKQKAVRESFPRMLDVLTSGRKGQQIKAASSIVDVLGEIELEDVGGALSRRLVRGSEFRKWWETTASSYSRSGGKVDIGELSQGLGGPERYVYVFKTLLDYYIRNNKDSEVNVTVFNQKPDGSKNINKTVQGKR